MSSARPALTRFCDPDTGKPVGAGPTGAGYLSRFTRLGTMFTNPEATQASTRAAVPPDADVQALQVEIRELGRAAKAGDADAKARLGVLRDREYARPDGGRTTIKRTLVPFGFGKPAPAPA